MIKLTRIAPSNSLVFVADPSASGDVIPEWVEGASITSTSSCVGINCLPETDGMTEILLGTASELDPGFAPAFDGQLETPSRVVAVRSVSGEVILKTDVPDHRTHIKVWTNHPTDPDRVIVGTAS